MSTFFGGAAVPVVDPGPILLQPNMERIPKLLANLLKDDASDDVERTLFYLGHRMRLCERDSKDFWKETNSLGAYLPVLFAMRKWQQKKKIQLFGCNCLA